MLCDERRNLGADADIAGRLVNDYEPAGFGHGFENRLDVDRTQSRKIDDLGADPSVLEFRDRTQRFDGHCTPRNDGHVRAFAQDEANVEWQRLAVITDF